MADQSNSIDYRDLRSVGGTFSPLFVDYVSDFSKVQQFYTWNFRNEAHWKSLLKRVAERSIDRSSLVKILGEQNRNADASEHRRSSE
jgi:hypothetical protein